MVLFRCRRTIKSMSSDSSTSSDQCLLGPNKKVVNKPNPLMKAVQEFNGNNRLRTYSHDKTSRYSSSCSRRPASLLGSKFLPPSPQHEERVEPDTLVDTSNHIFGNEVSPIPAYVYVPREFSYSYSSSDEDEAGVQDASSSEEEESVMTFSQEFRQWQAFPNATELQHNTTWGFTMAKLDDEGEMLTLRPDYYYWPSDEETKVDARQAPSKMSATNLLLPHTIPTEEPSFKEAREGVEWTLPDHVNHRQRSV